jgi:hypothetical protein
MMNHLHHMQLEVALQRYHELRREAGAERLLRRAKQADAERQSLRRRLGEGLIALGRLLAPQIAPSVRPLALRTELARPDRNGGSRTYRVAQDAKTGNKVRPQL